MDLENNEKIIEFLNNLCKNIKFKDAHKEIKLEFLTHLEDKILYYMEKGYSENDSIKYALIEMGDINSIGKSLNKSYSGNINYSIIFLSLLLIIIGIILSYRISILNILIFNNINIKKTFFSIFIGINISLLLYFIDYRKLNKHYKNLFLISIFFSILTPILGSPINGRKTCLFMENINIDLSNYVLILVLISNCIILFNKDNFKIPKFLLPYIIFLFTSFPLTLCNYNIFILYLLCFLVILYNSNYSLKYIFSFLFFNSIIIGIFIFLVKQCKIISTIIPLDSYKYIHYQITEILKHSKLWGASSNISIHNIPNLHSNLILTFIIYNLGWIVALTILTLTLLFIIKLYKLSFKIKESIGKNIIKTLSTLLFIQFIFFILTNLGITSTICSSLLFISYGNNNIIFNLIIVGIITSIYRRRSLSINI